MISICRNFSNKTNQDLLAAQFSSLKRNFSKMYDREAYYFYKFAVEIAEKNPENQICLNALITATYSLCWNHYDIIRLHEVVQDKFNRFQKLIGDCSEKPELIIGLLQTIDRVCYQKDEGALSWVGDLILNLTRDCTKFDSAELRAAAAMSLSHFALNFYEHSTEEEIAQEEFRTDKRLEAVMERL